MKKFECTVCGFVYDEATGDPDNGIAPGTKWEDLPDDYTCPLCGVGKEDFQEINRFTFLMQKKFYKYVNGLDTQGKLSNVTQLYVVKI